VEKGVSNNSGKAIVQIEVAPNVMVESQASAKEGMGP